jgi:AcrR family transcriptional regulator
MGTGQPLNKRQIQAAATRQRMLSASRNVFEEQGYRAATVGAITRAADTAHGTFYLHFRNKDDAFLQVMASVGEEMRDGPQLGSSADPEAIEAVMRRFVDVFVDHAGLWRALLEGLLVSETVEQVWMQARADFVGRLARWLQREQEAGLVRTLDGRQTALALGSMTEWYAFTALILPEQPAEGAADAVVRTLTDLWYHALYGTTVS